MMVTRRSLVRAFIRELRARPNRGWNHFQLLLIQLASRVRINKANSSLSASSATTKQGIASARKQFISTYKKPATVTIICSTNRAQNSDKIIDNINRQNYPNLEVVIVLHGINSGNNQASQMFSKINKPFRILEIASQKTFGEALNAGLASAKGVYSTKFDDDDDYGANHIWDLVAAIETSRAELVGKGGHYVYLPSSNQVVDFGLEHASRYVYHLPGGTILGKTKHLQSLKFDNVNQAIDSNICSKILRRGGLLYSTHPYNYVRIRSGNHTYSRADESFIKSSQSAPRSGYSLSDYEA